MGDKILHKYIPNITPHFAFLTTHILILLRFLARLTTENHGFLLHQQLLHNFHRVTHPLSQTYHIALWQRELQNPHLHFFPTCSGKS